MRLGALDLVERMRRRDKYLLRHAPSVRACATEKIGLDHGDFEPRLPCRHGDTPALPPPRITTSNLRVGMPRSPPKLTAREWHTATSGTIGQAIRFRAVRR